MRFPSLLLAVASLSWLSLATTSGTLNGSGQSLNPRLTTIPLSSRDLPVGTCNSDTPCANGACCGSDNLCGYSDKSCGTGCQFNCDAKAECGPYAALGSQQCPLNVCCSEFGFCGSTSEFCSWKNADDPLYPTCDTQYGGCGDVTRPSCSGNSVAKRNIGYYESWSNTRKCQSMTPEDLNVDQFSHINFAFSFFDPTTFQITPMDANGASLYHRFTALKSQKASLETWISVGGWSFTDPGATQTAFSDMSSSSENRQKFISGLIKFMSTYGFDGVDLDWEYPGADDRGGSEDDVANYVTLVADMKSAFGSKYGLTVTLPTSYWYLQHFDLAGLEENVDWFNVMAYDLHGVWDRDSKNLGPYIAPHTNITEIDLALDLIWRSGVKSDKVVMGQGWYGRSFTLVDPSCNTPNGVCEFSAGANAGPCSNAAGILDLQEINDIISTKSLKPVHDQKAGVKWITWDSNQWVSYDDADTFKQKRDFANSRCLGGLMVWAMDQIDQSSSSSYSAAPVVSSDQLSSAKQASADQQASITCYTSDCNSPCKVGTNSIAEMNGQPGQLSTANRCTKGEYRKLCCESATVVGKCQWRGFRGAGLACTSGCADGETELVKDTNNHDSKKGDQTCNGGLQSYCCSGYEPAPSKATLAKEVADKAKEAAKAAAEAAAEQVALDIAAKAFCRVAVPALLLPLELLEDLIPIVGEILDAIEIAATPAIIQGCVKGIEKEGKAEFKVFGKKHTVSMDKPTATPTKEIPAAKTNNPPKTSEKPPSCSTKSKAKLAKRAPPATAANKRKYVDDDPMKVLVRTAKRANEAWKDGDGWAIMQAWPPTGLVPIPEHYLLVVGIVSVKIETEDVKDCNGKVTGQNEIWTRNYVARPYDIAPSNDPALDKKCVLIPRSAKTSTWWLNKGANSAYTDEGAINPIFSTEENIKKIALARADAMGKYSYTMNNCRTYTDDLAAHLK